MVGQLRRTSEVFLVLQPVREVEVNGDTLPAKPWYELFPSQNSCQRAVFDMNTLYTDPIRGRITAVGAAAAEQLPAEEAVPAVAVRRARWAEAPASQAGPNRTPPYPKRLHDA